MSVQPMFTTDNAPAARTHRPVKLKLSFWRSLFG
jgi:hypothetical protein